MRVYAKKVATLFSPGISDLPKAYTDFTRNLDNSELKRLITAIYAKLENVKKLKAANVFLIGSILKLSGTPPGKLLDFFARFLKEKISLQNYTYCLNTIFQKTAPLPSDILFDLTEYTYLDRNIILKKSIELSGKFQKKKPADLVLYLLILSQRSDLSNENLKLILLLLRSTASKNILHEIGPRYFEILNGIHDTQKDIVSGSGERHAVRHAGNSEHASYYLDKHFSDNKNVQEELVSPPARGISSRHVEKKNKKQASVLLQESTPAVETTQKEDNTLSAQGPEEILEVRTASIPLQPGTIIGILKEHKKVWIPALLIAAAAGIGIMFSAGNIGKQANTAKQTASVGYTSETASDTESKDKTRQPVSRAQQDIAVSDGVPEKNDSDISGDSISDHEVGSIIQNHYTVKKGDTLSGISKKYYDNANRYTAIAEKNNIANPNLIYPGHTLIIPDHQEK